MPDENLSLSNIKLNGTKYELKDSLVREILLTPSSENIDKVWKTVGLSSMTISDIIAQTTINLTGTGDHVSILYWPEEDEEYIVSFDLYDGDTLVETVNETLISSGDVDVVFGFGGDYNFILTAKNDNSVFLDYMKESQGSPYKLVNLHIYQEIPITIPDTGWYNDQQIYKVNVTYDENNDTYSSDKTAVEIYNAYNTLKQIPVVYFYNSIFINDAVSTGRAMYNHQYGVYYNSKFYNIATYSGQKTLRMIQIDFMSMIGHSVTYSEYNISNFSGEYDDLYNKPTIPSSISDLTNDSNFMVKGTDYVTAGQLEGSTLGTKATAEGYNTIAKGDYSHAEGYCTSTGTNGQNIKAPHAEGGYTLAEGGGSHAEGIGTGTPYFFLSDGSASYGSHSEGCYNNSIEIDINGNANVTTYNCNYGSVANLTEERINQLVMVSTGTGQFFGPRLLKSIDTANNTITVDKTFNTDNAVSGRLCLCTTANRQAAHAEGSGTYSKGSHGHSEGYLTIANYGSHAEGSHTIANFYSHSEGNYTKAVGYYSHAEGNNTIAQKQSQHVFGEYNIADTYGGTSKGRYIEIIGNGTADNARSNARTLDWSGNEVLAGKLTVGTGPTANMDVATKQYVDSSIPTVPTDISDLTDTNNIIPEDKIYPVNVTLTSTTAGTSDKSHTEINTAVAAGKVPFVYISFGGENMVANLVRANSANAIFVYEDQAATGNGALNYGTLTITNKAVSIDWKDKYSTSTFDGSYNSLTDTPTIPTDVSDLTDNSNIIPDVSDFISSETDPVFTASPAYGITSNDISTWSAKSDFSGSYNDLTDKPTIPAAQVQSDWNATSGMGVILNKPTSISGYGITDAYTKSEVDGLVSGVLHYKGTKTTVSALPSSGNVTGDVWHVSADGSEWAWDGSEWQELGTATDLSGYVPTSTTVNGKALTSNISLTASDVDALSSSTTYVSSFNGESGAITYTAPVTSVNGQTGAVSLTIPDAITISKNDTVQACYPLLQQSTGNVAAYITDGFQITTYGTTNTLQIGKTSSSRIGGKIKLVNGSMGTAATIETGGGMTSSITLTLPSATGTLALTSQIPSVPSWALESSKPSYTASEVGALASNTTYVSTFNGQSGAITYTAPVTSVNGQTGAVTTSNTTYTLSMSGNRITLTPSSGTATYVDLPVFNGSVT